MMASNASAEQPPTADEGNNGLAVQQISQTVNSGNPNAISVSVLSPQKQQYLPDNPEDNLGALDKRPISNSS